jgi:hypothetical protein
MPDTHKLTCLMPTLMTLCASSLTNTSRALTAVAAAVAGGVSRARNSVACALKSEHSLASPPSAHSIARYSSISSALSPSGCVSSVALRCDDSDDVETCGKLCCVFTPDAAICARNGQSKATRANKMCTVGPYNHTLQTPYANTSLPPIRAMQH